MKLDACHDRYGTMTEAGDNAISAWASIADAKAAFETAWDAMPKGERVDWLLDEQGLDLAEAEWLAKRTGARAFREMGA